MAHNLSILTLTIFVLPILFPFQALFLHLYTILPGGNYTVEVKLKSCFLPG